MDKMSRSRWERRNEAGMDLALQVSKTKSFPWPDCSNVAFPLVTIAAMQFHARAYPSIITGESTVKCRVNGEDGDGSMTARADRVSTHMSWQVMEEDTAWEEQHDRLLLNVGIVGCAFIKTYRSSSEGHNVSELVLAKDLVVDYYAKSIETAARKTQLLDMHRNDIWERVRRGAFRDVLEEAWFLSPAQRADDGQQVKQDGRQGINPPPPDEQTSFRLLEQHALLDLDGDGYAEPYIVTVEAASETVLRIVTAFDKPEHVERDSARRIIAVQRMQYYTKYPFIPSPDGGLYDIGFGVLLGPLNESVNSVINQLFDAGTMATTAGGFLGRGVKIRGGVHKIDPFTWNRLESTSEDISKGIFPLPVREPSPVLFNLLSLLINYTNRVSGANDMMVGENPGQNTPAETTRAMVQEGMKIYNAIFKRVWRAMKEEFRKLYVLNAIFLPNSLSFGPAGTTIYKADYLGNPNSISPAADPNITSEGAAFIQAQAIKQDSLATPGYDIEAVTRRYLKALKVPAIEELYPGMEKMPPPKDIKLQIAELKEQTIRAKMETEQAIAVRELMLEEQRISAEISKLQADIMLKLEELKGDISDREIQRMNAFLGMMKEQANVMRAKIDLAMKQMETGGQTHEKRMDVLNFAADNAARVKELSQKDRELDQTDEELRIKDKVASKPVAAKA